MFQVAGEASFLAEEAGATRVVLLDGMDPSEEFQAKHAARSSAVRYLIPRPEVYRERGEARRARVGDHPVPAWGAAVPRNRRGGPGGLFRAP